MLATSIELHGFLWNPGKDRAPGGDGSYSGFRARSRGCG